jgi:RNA polymerase sigma-70 factor (ECF subfamily)
MKPELDLAFADYAAAYKADPEQTLFALQALLLDVGACRARIQFLQELARTAAEAPSHEQTSDFTAEIRTLSRMGLFSAVRQHLLEPQRLMALTDDPKALWQAHCSITEADAQTAESGEQAAAAGKDPQTVAGSRLEPDSAAHKALELPSEIPQPASEPVNAIDQPGLGTPQNLNQISTMWSMVKRAHDDSPETASPALQALLQRYSGAAYRYLLATLKDPHAADDLLQEFSLRFVRGDFRNADPQRGRFRDLVKTVLFHLIIDHQRRQKAGPRALPPDDCGPAQPVDESLTSDAQFITSWRQQLLSRAWAALSSYDSHHGSRYYEVLRFRAENADLTSAEMAEKLSARMEKEVSADWVRQNLRRARKEFAELLLEELSHSIDNPTRERLAEELVDLRLLQYCKHALGRWPEQP